MGGGQEERLGGNVVGAVEARVARASTRVGSLTLRTKIKEKW